MIPIAEPVIGELELQYVTECIRSGWISSLGDFIPRFENAYARYCGTRYAITTSNGTTALHLVLHALGVGPGDEVVLPTLTFVATANAVAYTGAIPVFVDSEWATWNIDPAQIEAQITQRTKAILAVHLYGHPSDMDTINSIAQKHHLVVLEDAAEAHGAKYKGRMTGSLARAACFSFYGNKTITTGEGGMITTDDADLAERCRFLRDQAMSPDDRYWHTEIGFNYRLTNVQAAIGLAQLEQIDEFLAAKRRNAEMYRSLLARIPGIIPSPAADWAESSYWLYSILIDGASDLTRDELANRLRGAGIDSRPFFHPMHTLPIYQRLHPGLVLPVAEQLSAYGLNLPSGSSLSMDQIQCICETIKATVAGSPVNGMSRKRHIPS